jgi:ribose transport system substrate-binding protein
MRLTHYFLWLVAFIASLAGCDSTPLASTDSQSSSAKSSTAKSTTAKKLRIAVIPKGTSHQFWRSVHAGSQAAADELGNVEIIWKGPESEGDTAGQISVVKNFITNHVDGIVLAPNHSHALVDVVSEANAENIPVVVFDSGLAAGPKLVSYVATDNQRGGRLAAECLAEAIGQQGKVILLRYKEGSESTEQREKGFLEAMKDKSGIEVLSADQYAGTTTQEAMAKATQLLNKYRDSLNGIFAVCEPNCNGVMEALVQTGMAGKVKFVAFDPSDGLIRGLSNGKVSGIVLQDPYEMGRKSVLTLAAHLRGEKVESVVSTGENVATPNNLDQDPIPRLLNPAQL